MWLLVPPQGCFRYSCVISLPMGTTLFLWVGSIPVLQIIAWSDGVIFSPQNLKRKPLAGRLVLAHNLDVANPSSKKCANNLLWFIYASARSLGKHDSEEFLHRFLFLSVRTTLSDFAADVLCESEFFHADCLQLLKKVHDCAGITCKWDLCFILFYYLLSNFIF